MVIIIEGGIKMVICNQCSHELPEGSVFCNKCGNKIILNDGTSKHKINESNKESEHVNDNIHNSIKEDTNNTKKPKGKKILLVSIIIFFLMSISAGGLYYYFGIVKKQEAKENYDSNLRNVVLEMLETTVLAEKMIAGYSEIWSAAIDSNYGIYINVGTSLGVSYTNKKLGDEKDYYLNRSRGEYASDFNEAIDIVRKQFKEFGGMDDLIGKRRDIDKKMQSLNNPPKEYQIAYEIAFQMYGYFNEYVSLAESPNGSLRSFNDNANELSSQIIKKINEFKVRLPL